MELVASARLRRAQERIEAMRPYADRMLELMAGTARASASVRGLPLLQRREVSTVAIVPVTGDRGLAGAFNAQILRRSIALYRELQAEGLDVRWLPVGRKGTSTLRFLALRARRSVGRLQRQPALPGRAGDRASVDRALHRGRRRPRDRRLQPLRLAARPARHGDRRPARSPRTCSRPITPSAPRYTLRGDFIFEPEPEEILERLLPVYLETELYRALLESAASEQGARMTAMRNASKSAGELIDDPHPAHEPRAPGRDHAGAPLRSSPAPTR